QRMETLNHLIISKDLNYVSEIEYLESREKIEKNTSKSN
ncbi:four helix bundle protein, partial [Flavobacterium sp. YO12]